MKKTIINKEIENVKDFKIASKGIANFYIPSIKIILISLLFLLVISLVSATYFDDYVAVGITAIYTDDFKEGDTTNMVNYVEALGTGIQIVSEILIDDVVAFGELLVPDTLNCSTNLTITLNVEKDSNNYWSIYIMTDNTTTVSANYLDSAGAIAYMFHGTLGDCYIREIYHSENTIIVATPSLVDGEIVIEINETYAKLFVDGGLVYGYEITGNVDLSGGCYVALASHAGQAWGYDVVNWSIISEGAEASDVTPPVITLDATNGTSSTKTGEDVHFNATCTDETAGSHMVLGFDDGVGTYTNDTAETFTSPEHYSIIKTITATRGETVNAIFYCNDSSNNWVESSVLSFVVNNTAPTITSLSPADNYEDNKNTTFGGVYTDADGDIGNCTLYINNTADVSNHSITSGNIFNITTTKMIAEEDYSWYFNCTDEYDITTSTERTITLDTTAPIITWYTPPSTVYTTATTYDVNTTGTDDSEVWSFNYTLFNEAGVSTESHTDFNFGTASYNNQSTFTLNQNQNNTIQVEWWDAHSGEVIDDKLKKGKKGETEFIINSTEGLNYKMALRFVEKEDKDTNTPADVKSTFEYTEDGTKIIFGFNFTVLTPETKPVIDVSVNTMLHYLNHSNYKAHLIWDKFLTDFEATFKVNGIEKNYSVEVERIDEYNVSVKIIPDELLNGNDFVEFISHSIEGLNKKAENRTIIHDTIPPVWNNNLTNISGSKYGDTFWVSINWSDTSYVNYSWLSIENTSGWYNFTPSAINKLSGIHNTTYIIDMIKDQLFNWTFYANDSLGNINQTDIWGFTVANTAPPTPTNIIWETTGGFTDNTLLFNQIIDYVNVTCTPDIDGDEQGCNITITSPSGTVIDNQPMTNSTDYYEYTTDFTLNVVGTWTVSITAYDEDTSTASRTFTVSVTVPSLFDGYFVWDFNEIPTHVDVTNEYNNYGFDTVGLTLNWSRFDNDYIPLKTLINSSKENHSVKSFVRMFFDGNYDPSDTYTNTTCSKINTNLTDFSVYPYEESIIFILMDLNDTQEYKVNFSNVIAECILNASSNVFPVYVDYSNESLDSNVVSSFNLTRITAQNNQTYVQLEKEYLRNSTKLTRIYYDSPTQVKELIKKYHDNIITNIRGTPIVTSITNESVAEINNGDIVAFNNGSSILTFTSIDVSDVLRTGKDVWDSTEKIFIEADTNGFITFSIQAYSFSNIYFDTIDHLTLTTVQGAVTTGDQFYGWNRTGETTSAYSVVGANDAMFYAYDPSYGQYNQFFIHYEWINSSYVTNYTDYCDGSAVIIADYNSLAINETIGCLDKTFGYISVADYEDSDSWQTNKTEEIDIWIDDYGIQVFLDGLDTGAAGTNFGKRFRKLVDHIEIAKTSTCIANDYTAYTEAGVGGICEYDMKESFCGRWDGNVADPTYTKETFSVDYDRAVWARTNNNPQLLMTFGNRLNITKQMYCYSEYLVLYGNSNHLFRYGQPNFQGQQEIYTYDAGTQLENTWTETNSTYYYRKYSNGVIWFDPTSDDWGIEDNKVMNNLTMYIKAQIYTATPAASTPISIDVNGNALSPITYDEIGTSQWDTKIISRDLTQYYDKDGRYVIRFYSSDAADPVGLNIWKTEHNRTGVFSFHDTSVNNPPADGSTDWTAYGRSGDNEDYLTNNWYAYLTSNDTTSSLIDNGITDITQTNITFNTNTNITFSATKDYNISIWGNPVTVAQYTNLSYWNGTVFKRMHPINTPTCDSLNPTWNSTTIDGEVHKACIESFGTDTIVRIATPHLSTQVYQILGDSTDPVIDSLDDLVNDTNSSINTIQHNFTVTEDNPDTAILYINGIANETLAYANGSNSFSAITYEDGYYNWTVWVNDTAGNEGWFSDNYTLTIDTTNPLISYSGGTLNTSTYYSQDWIYVNVSVTELNFKNITFYLNETNETSYTTETFYHNFTGLSDGSFSINVTIYDTAGNKNSTTTRTNIVLDTTNPIVSLETANYTNFTTQTITLNYNVSDTNSIANCSLYLNGTLNKTDTSITKDTTQSFILALNNNDYLWKVGCFDNVDNLGNSTEYKFNVKITIEEIEEEAVGGLGGGSGQVVESYIEPVNNSCQEGYLMWNDKCYECAGQLKQVGNDITCVTCNEGFEWDINSQTCVPVSLFEKPFFQENKIGKFINTASSNLIPQNPMLGFFALCFISLIILSAILESAGIYRFGYGLNKRLWLKKLMTKGSR